MNGHPFDAKHTFIVNLFTEIERFSTLDEGYSEPKAEVYQSRVSPNVRPLNVDLSLE